MRPLDALGAVAEILGRSETPAVRALGPVLSRLAAGEPTDSDLEALGLRRRPGQLSLATERAIEQRNECIRRAALFLPLGARPRLLAERWADYAASSWQRDRLAEQCPPRLEGTLYAELWAALKAWPRVCGERQVATILRAGNEIGDLISDHSEFEHEALMFESTNRRPIDG